MIQIIFTIIVTILSSSSPETGLQTLLSTDEQETCLNAIDKLFKTAIGTDSEKAFNTIKQELRDRQNPSPYYFELCLKLIKELRPNPQNLHDLDQHLQNQLYDFALFDQIAGDIELFPDCIDIQADIIIKQKDNTGEEGQQSLATKFDKTYSNLETLVHEAMNISVSDIFLN